MNRVTKISNINFTDCALVKEKSVLSCRLGGYEISGSSYNGSDE